MPTLNAPQPKMTRVCAEAPDGHRELPACSGGWCRCHIPELDPPVEAVGPADGRFVAPEPVLAELQAIRAARRKIRRGGAR